MDDFTSLSVALLPHFERNFVDLPADIQQRVAKAFSLLPWDSTPSIYRRYRAITWDFDHDPSCAGAQERMWDLYCRVAETEAAAAPTVTDLELRETRIRRFESEIQEEQARMETAAFARWHLPTDFLPSGTSNAVFAATTGTGLPGRPSHTVHLIQDEMDRRITANNLEDGVNKQAEVLFEWLRNEHPTLARPKVASIANAIRAKFRAARKAIPQN